MGYGWMMGLGQALGDIGKNQIPDFMDRRRQAQQDTEKAKQEALDYALRQRAMTNDEARTGLQREELLGTQAYRNKDLGLREKGQFLDTIPMMTGRKVAGSPFGDQLSAAGLGSMIGADGTLTPGYVDQFKVKELNAGIARDNASAAAAMANAESNRTNRDAMAFQRRMSALEMPQTPALAALYKALADPMNQSPEAQSGYASQVAAARRDAVLEQLNRLKLVDPKAAADYEALWADTLKGGSAAPAAGAAPGAGGPINWGGLF